MNRNTYHKPHRTARPGRRRGLTLIELIVVLVILVALGGLLVPTFSGLGDQARRDATTTTLSRVAQAIVGADGYQEVMRYARDDDDSVFVGHGTGLPWPSPDEVTAGRADHPQLRYLFNMPTGLLDYDSDAAPGAVQFYDPVSRVGWRGPWLSVTTATAYTVNAADGFTDVYGQGDGGGGPAVDDDLAPLDGWGNPVVIQLPNADPDEVDNVRLVSAGPDRVLDTPGDVLTPSAAEKNDDLVLYLYREDPNP